MNKFIINSANYFKLNNISKLLLLRNPELLEDRVYIFGIFEKSCLESNLELSIFLYENNIQLTQVYSSNYFYSKLFVDMCSYSNINMITWFYNMFGSLINLEDIKYVLSSLYNPDFNVVKFIMSKHKYSKQLYEYIFKMSIGKLNLPLAKLIYSEKPEINLKILNGMNLYNSIDIYTPKIIFEWLKSIGMEQSYIIRIINNYELVVIDELNISDEPPVFDVFNIFKDANHTNQLVNDDNECVLCFEHTNDVILNCSHKFCSHCIRKWIKKNHSCPTCRNDKNVKGYYIYTE
jgi:hypothetical protein